VASLQSGEQGRPASGANAAISLRSLILINEHIGTMAEKL
jgi:hypothetical protein